MNRKQLLALGLPHACLPAAFQCIEQAVANGLIEPPTATVSRLISNPELYRADPIWSALVNALQSVAVGPDHVPIDYAIWGKDLDAAAHQQMANACRLPVSRGAALMPDAHVGYGLPIGGVLACQDALVPYAVGVDIACRVKLSITDLDPLPLQLNDAAENQSLDRALQRGTVFGMGGAHRSRQAHAVMDEDWAAVPVTRENRDRAWKQLGTSGSGNHFVEWGLVILPDRALGIEAGTYVGLLSHSGSRGTGAAVCRRYTEIAQKLAPSYIRNDNQLRYLAWLDTHSEAGQEYWLAMNLMGRYASANHEVIHRNVLELAGATALASVENHHNFAWQETHGDQRLFVHRKGATPAGPGVLGIIPGNMADSCFVVRGKGESKSLRSAAHGAGRCMSRTEAKKRFRWKEWREFLSARRVRLLAGGLDEVPGAYKNIHEVMAEQADLVETVGQFQPRIVMMCGDDSRPED